MKRKKKILAFRLEVVHNNSFYFYSVTEQEAEDAVKTLVNFKKKYI